MHIAPWHYCSSSCVMYVVLQCSSALARPVPAYLSASLGYLTANWRLSSAWCNNVKLKDSSVIMLFT